MRSLNSVPLSALRAIEAIGRSGTLGRAASELGVTPGALSQRLAKAEAVFGQKLFHRTAAGLTPTEACLACVPRLTRAMTDLSAVVGELSTGQNCSLTVSVAPIFASRWLIWRIKSFNEDNPSITVRIDPRVDIVDLDRSEIDVGIRVGSEASVGQGAIRLLDQRVFPVCSPDLVDKITCAADLFALPIIRENDRFYGWPIWLAERGMAMPDIGAGPVYGDASLCLDAAMAGQGVFMAWESLACDALDRGQIAAPFSQRSVTDAAYWFATNRFSAHKIGVRKFQSWLQGELESSIKGWEAADAEGA
ncbi:MAG: LysR substrate-binding domain-containing protein [Pseudomonadota bacterium]